MIVIIADVCMFVRPCKRLCASKHECRPVAACLAGKIHIGATLKHHTQKPASVSHAARAWRVLALIISHQLGILHHMEEVRIPDVPSG